MQPFPERSDSEKLPAWPDVLGAILFVPVSYTHLDVYKRQGAKRWPRVAFHKKRIAMPRPDVYKRQGNHLGLITEIFREHGADGAVDQMCIRDSGRVD